MKTRPYTDFHQTKCLFLDTGVSHGIYHYWYFGLTVTFILLPSLTMTGFSFRWYLMDADNSQLPEVPMWRWILR